MFCTKCGNQLPDDAGFCSECGNKVSEESYEEHNDVIAKTKEVKERKKISFNFPNIIPKQKFGLIAIALIAVLVVGFLAMDSLVYAMSPEKYILSSINKTYKSVTKDLDKMGTLLMGNVDPNGSTTNHIGISIDNLGTTDYYSDLDMFSGMGIDITTSMDRSKKELHLSATSTLRERDFVTLNAKLDDNELLVSIPEAYHKAFSVPSKNLGREWNNSYLGMQSYTKADESLDISFSELINDSRAAVAMDDSTKKEYLKVFETLTQNAIYEKDGTQELYIGNKDQKCNRTRIILNERDIKSGIIALIDAIGNDNRVESWKDTLRSTNQHYTVNEFEQSLNQIRDEIGEYFQVDRMVLDVYTTKGGLVKVDLSIIPDLDYREDTVTLGMELFGEKSLMDDFSFTMFIGEYEEGKMEFISKGNHSGAKNQFINDTSFVVYDYGSEVVNIASKVEIDLSQGRDNFKYDLDLEIDDQSISLITKGDFTSSSKKVDYNLKDISIRGQDYYYGDEFYFNGGLRLSWEEGARDVSNLGNVEKLPFLDIAEYDFYDTMSIIESNMSGIANFFEGY